MKKTCLLALMVLTSATVASAADKDKKDDSKTAAADKNKKSDKDKVICRTDRATGSLIRANRICHTKEEWDEISQQTSRDLNDISRQENTGSGASSALTPGG